MIKKILLFSFLLFACKLSAQQLVTDHSMKNSVRFTANATFGDFQGSTNALYGNLYIKNSKLAEGDSLNFFVYLDSLDTGIGLRNSHMRKNYLKTNLYPLAYFSGKVAAIDSISVLESKVLVRGEFHVHGMKKPKEFYGKFFSYGRMFKIIATFNIKLSDFKIKQPSFLFNTVKDNIIVDAVIYLKRKNKT